MTIYYTLRDDDEYASDDETAAIQHIYMKYKDVIADLEQTEIPKFVEKQLEEQRYEDLTKWQKNYLSNVDDLGFFYEDPYDGLCDDE